MLIQFKKWEAGHHGTTPDPIPVDDLAQAELILKAISHAMSQPDSCVAIIKGDSGMVRKYYVADDHVSELQE